MLHSDRKLRRAETNRDAREVFGRRLMPVIVLLSAIVASVAVALFYVAMTVRQETSRQFLHQHVLVMIDAATERLRERATEFDRPQITQDDLDERVSSSRFLSRALLINAQTWTSTADNSDDEFDPGDMAQFLASFHDDEEEVTRKIGEAVGFVRAGSALHMALARKLTSEAGAARVLLLSVDVKTLLDGAQPDGAPAQNFRVRISEGLSAKSGVPLRSLSGETLGTVVADSQFSGPDMARTLIVPLALCLLVILIAGTAIVIRFRRSRDDAIRWANQIARTSEEIADREAQAQEAKRVAEVANHAKTEFLANMSHELRTPLNAVIGFSELIADEVMGPIGSEIYKEYSRDIRASGEHLLEIINEILDLSKIEAGRMTLDEQVFSVDRVLSASLRLVRERANANGIALTSEVQPGIPDLRGDERMIRQMMTNFLSNAVKFTPENGQVHVQARCLDDGAIEIAVSDTGIGMSTEHMETAMLPFRQVSSSLARKHEGTGLGLPLAKSFIDLHNGRLDIESELKKGTTVRVTFPSERSIPTR